MQPGDTITPQNKSDDNGVEVSIPRDDPIEVSTPPAPAPPALPQSPIASVPIPSQPLVPAPIQNNSGPEPEPDQETQPEPTPWQYAQGYDDSSNTQQPGDLKPISWTASEFIDHEKNASWFTGLAAATGALVTIIFLITRDVMTVIVIALVAILFGMTAHRKPRVLEYQLTNEGVGVGNRFYPYHSLKTFSVLEEGAFNSIQLTPLKRFMPPISLYFPLEQEEQIINMLGSYLPHEDRTHDPIDRLMRKVRF
ncbi:MAG: hypothetical protein V4702_05350 [Patescibacteria group bacterium]